MTNTITAAFQTLHEEINKVYGQTVQNIADAKKRLAELENEMIESGSDTLEAVQANTKMQLEHDQVRAFMDSQKNKLKQLKEAHSKEVYDEIYKLKNTVLEKEQAKKREEAKKQALDHWNAIKAIDSELHEYIHETSATFFSEASGLNTYMLDKEKRSAEISFSGSFAQYSTLNEQLKDGRLG